MARYLSNTKVLATSLADAIAPFSVFRRGYAAVSHGGLSGNLSGPARKIEDMPVGSRSAGCEAYTAWAPDPITGYYRPANCPLEVDPAEFREMLLSHRVIRPSSSKTVP